MPLLFRKLRSIPNDIYLGAESMRIRLIVGYLGPQDWEWGRTNTGALKGICMRTIIAIIAAALVGLRTMMVVIIITVVRIIMPGSFIDCVLSLLLRLFRCLQLRLVFGWFLLAF